MPRLRLAGPPWALILALAAAPAAPALKPPRPAGGMLRAWSAGPLRPGRFPASRPALRHPAPPPGRVPAAGFPGPAGPLRRQDGARPGPLPPPRAAITVKASALQLRSCGQCRLDTVPPGGPWSDWHWTVEEAGGGTLGRDPAGRIIYTAPLVSGRRCFHVRAASLLDPSFAGRVAIEVLPNALLAVLEAGTAGAGAPPVLDWVARGPSALAEGDDRWVEAARFAAPRDLAWLPRTGQWLVSYPGNRAFGFPAGVMLQDLAGTPDPRDLGQDAPLAAPTCLADNGCQGPDWRCVLAETEQDRIRLMDARGVVVPLAGEGGGHQLRPGDKHRDGRPEQARFWAPEGVAMDRDGTVYVADVGNGALRRIRDGAVTTLVALPHAPGRYAWDEAGPGRKPFAAPLNGGLALDAGRRTLYVGVGHSVLGLALEGARQDEPRTVLGTPGKPGFEAWQADPPASLADVPCLYWPRHLACRQGRLFISDHGNHAIRVYDPDTGLRTLAGDPGQVATRPGPLRCGSPHLGPEHCAALAYPLGLAFDAAGELRVATRDGVVALRGLDTGIQGD